MPPAGWKHPCQVDMSDPRTFATNRQRIHTLQEGEGYTNGYDYTIAVGEIEIMLNPCVNKFFYIGI